MFVVPRQQAKDPTGVSLKRDFDPDNPVHFARKHKCVVDADSWSNLVLIKCETGLTSKLSGVKRINGFFETCVKKNSVIGASESVWPYGNVRNTYRHISFEPIVLRRICVDLRRIDMRLPLVLEPIGACWTRRKPFVVMVYRAA